MKRIPWLFVPLLAACSLGLEREPPDSARHLVEALREGPAGEPLPVRLEVRSFFASAPFTGARFVYRTGATSYETDFYREFLVSPERMLADQARGWLAAAGLASAVIGPGSRAAPTHALDADLVALYADFRDRAHAAAVLELRVFVTELPDRALAQRSYRETEPLEGADPDRFAEALGRALGRLLGRLEADLRPLLQPGG